MGSTTRISTRRLPETIRRRVEVATAMAWESLVDTHVLHAGYFVQLLGPALSLEEALARYLLEMDLGESVTTAVRTRVLVAIEADLGEEAGEAGGDGDAPPAAGGSEGEPGDDSDGDDGWRRFRPDRVVQSVRRRQRRLDQIESWVSLALARAEEAVITTHVENAITFAALLDELLPLDGAVQHYLSAVRLTGGRAQVVHQRTMARLADVHLPLPRG